MARAGGGGVADAAYHQRSAAVVAGLVAGWEVDCFHQSDYDGDEQWDIFMVSATTGEVVNLTNTRQISEESPTWSPRGAISLTW